jgi:hypothetical protein
MTCRLVLGGVEIPATASLELSQEYSYFGGYTSPPLRTCSGRAIHQERWRKLRIASSGNGPLPPGLAALDYSIPQLMQCAIPIGVRTAALVVTLPAGHRTDGEHVPTARAMMQGGQWWTVAPTTLAGNVLTISPVVGAEGYMVLYWPELQVLADYPQASGSGGLVRWSFTAEEV